MAVFVAALLVSGCASKGFDLDSVAVDTTITTSATPPKKDGPVDAERISDEVSIRNAVSSANLDALPGGRLYWANADTGSRGEASRIVEYRQEKLLCRRFTVSRESFQGVALYSAEICLAADGSWWTRAFDAV